MEALKAAMDLKQSKTAVRSAAGDSGSGLCESYCFAADAHTTTRGVFTALGITPHEAERSVRNVAALRVGPQYAATMTSLSLHWAIQLPFPQLTLIMRMLDAGPAAPDGP